MLLLVGGLVLYVVTALGVVGYALWRGGRDERTGAGLFLAAAAASEIAAETQHVMYHHPQYGVMVVDGLFLLALLWLAQRSRKFWPLWAAASQLVGFLSHLAKIAHPGMTVEAYATIQPFWAFPLLGAIAVGTKWRPEGSRS